MDQQRYEEITVGDTERNAPNSATSFFRQLLVGTVVWSSYFQMGLCLGSPTVFIPQLRREARNDTAVTPEMASWLSSAYHYSAVPWGVILPVMAHVVGRRRTFTFVCVTTLAGFTCFYFSTNLTQLLISDVIQGILVANQITICLMILTEYVSPQYRGIFLTIKSATGYWGIWAANTIGTFLHWKNIGLFGIACGFYNIVLVIFWPESPYWLAGKGRLAQCKESHRWLRGCGKVAEDELKDIVNIQTQIEQKNPNIKEILKGITAREFYIPMVLCCCLTAMSQCSGKIVFSMYAIDIIKKITASESAAYSGMLILDGITVLGMYVGCVTSRYLARRTLLFGAEVVGISFLCVMSLYLYFIQLGFISENVYASIFMMMAFSMSISCGPIILSTSLCGELTPIRFRTFAVILISLMTNIMTGTTIKVAPKVFETFNLHGGFLLFAISSTFFLILLYKYLPETKNKTLKEIERYFKNDTDRIDGKELNLLSS